jgi:DNA-binding MarR family transcriptional regulator
MLSDDMATKNAKTTRTTDLCYSLATRQFSRLLGRIYQKHLDPTSISAGDFAVMEFLSQNSEMTMNDLAAELVMERTTLVRTLKPLQAKGLVVTKPDPTESRRLFISLTPLGEAKRQEALPHWAMAQGEVEQLIGKSVAQQLRDGIDTALKANRHS